MLYDLQNRWKLENGKLRYYGLRNKAKMFQNTVKLSSKQAAVVKRLPCELTETDLRAVRKLLGEQIVEAKDKRRTPSVLSEARFCKRCVANDFMLPGLEFDEEGLCPICQTEAETKNLKSVVPVKNTFPRAKKSRFDVAVFYTGGKDSTYLLYYLSKVLGLRVLALTWEIPYMSESAALSIAGAKRTLQNVEFIGRKIADDDLKRIYKRLLEMNGNTCACPAPAYALFYPILVAEKVPYFVVGNESAQLVGLYYNHFAPRLAYTFGNGTAFHALVNVGRVLTLRPPLKVGQFHTLATMKQLAYGDNPLKNLFGYENALVSNVAAAMRVVPNLVKPLKRAVRQSSHSGNIPAFVQVDLDAVSGGVYDWKKVKKTIVDECGWVPPADEAKGLHTSCRIEKCKEHTQFKRFYDMESTMMPFSALEIAIAVRDGAVSREDALEELQTSLGFSTEEVPECAIMRAYIES